MQTSTVWMTPAPQLSTPESETSTLGSFTLWEYYLAFIQADADGMTRQLTWATDKPVVDDWMLMVHAETEAYWGRLLKAREFTSRALVSAERGQDKERGATLEALGALREALFGNSTEARNGATSALALSTSRNVQPIAACALAFAGDTARARLLADDLEKRFPEDTIQRFNFLPTIRAAVEISRNAAKAVEVLKSAASLELGTASEVNFSLYPVYVRAQAYLAGHQGSEAATEFQKILDHRGIVLNSPISALAHLGLARAYAMQGDTAKAKAAYQDFLTLWKDADPDIPVFVAAKAEYAKLK